MYKIASKFKQRRESSVRLANVSPDTTDVSRYETTDLEKRDILGRKKNDLSHRVSEIRDELGIKSGVQHREVKGKVRYHRLFQEWVEIAGELQEIDKKLSALPKTRPPGILGEMIRILKEIDPDLYERLRRMAKDNEAVELKDDK